MSIPRFPSHPGMFFLGLALSVCLAMASVAQAQTQASCTFTFFPTILTSPNAQLFPSGINDFGTVVGPAFTTSNTGFIRWANGGLNFPSGTSSLVSRNDNGVSIGYNFHLNAITLVGANATPISVKIGANTYGGLGVSFVSINNWGSIVGLYGDSAGIAHGFKRWSNGNGFVLNFPATFKAINSGTFPTAINDSGIIVGFTQIPYHAFVYHNGKWATLQFPHAIATSLSGISNAGVIVGNAQLANGSTTGFLYKNGVFKAISAPNTTKSVVEGISLKSELILGLADSNSVFGGREGFIAKCN